MAGLMMLAELSSEKHRCVLQKLVQEFRQALGSFAINPQNPLQVSLVMHNEYLEKYAEHFREILASHGFLVKFEFSGRESRVSFDLLPCNVDDDYFKTASSNETPDSDLPHSISCQDLQHAIDNWVNVHSNGESEIPDALQMLATVFQKLWEDPKLTHCYFWKDQKFGLVPRDSPHDSTCVNNRKTYCLLDMAAVRFRVIRVPATAWNYLKH